MNARYIRAVKAALNEHQAELSTAGIFAGAFLVLLAWAYLMKDETPRSLPALPNAPGSVPPPATLMRDPVLTLLPGRVYRAALDLSFYVKALATHDKIASYAADLGFSSVTVTDNAPADWPKGGGDVSGADRFVVGRYAGAPKTMPRSQGPVTVLEAWEG